jgi:hypothetical protein
MSEYFFWLNFGVILVVIFYSQIYSQTYSQIYSQIYLGNDLKNASKTYETLVKPHTKSSSHHRRYMCCWLVSLKKVDSSIIKTSTDHVTFYRHHVIKWYTWTVAYMHFTWESWSIDHKHFTNKFWNVFQDIGSRRVLASGICVLREYQNGLHAS